MFLENKYTRWYFKIIDNAKNETRTKKSGTYYESHHIIPRSAGGKEEVLLTAKEHFICHLLLCRMTTGQLKHKMINALIRMTYSRSKGQLRYTARSYSVVRSLIAEKNREMFKGKSKSERVRQNMKGRLGKWERTPEYIERLKAALPDVKGENNPFYGKKHSEKTKQKWSEIRKGRKPAFTGKGSRWYTNGTVDKMCYPDNIPAGFYLGRSKNRKEKSDGMASKE